MRKRLLVALGVTLVPLAGGAVWWLSRGPGIDRVHYEQIKVGMWRGEVEAILGEPPGNPTGTQHFMSDEPMPPSLEWGDAESWVSDDGMVLVWFGLDETVQGKWFADPISAQPNWLEQVRAKLGL